MTTSKKKHHQSNTTTFSSRSPPPSPIPTDVDTPRKTEEARPTFKLVVPAKGPQETGVKSFKQQTLESEVMMLLYKTMVIAYYIPSDTLDSLYEVITAERER